MAGRAFEFPVGMAAFAPIAREYARTWSLPLWAIDPEGRVVLAGFDPAQPALGSSRRAEGFCESPQGAPPTEARRTCLAEAVRWGEPTILSFPPELLVWAVPLMRNARVLGGLVTCVPEGRVFPVLGGPPALDVRLAAADLRHLAERANLTNADYLAARRREYRREQHRADALHLSKLGGSDGRHLYLHHEPALLSAIRRDDRAIARGLINEILAAICYAAGGRIDLTKSLFMELVVMMGRTAIQAGSVGPRFLENSFARIAELSELEDEQALAQWLHQALEEVMDAVGSVRPPNGRRIAEALDYMEENLDQPIARRDAASAAGLSEGYFSRRFRAETGYSFSEMLRKMRVDRAAVLLVRTNLPIVQIALQCGFADQAYFTRVFREQTGVSPGRHRARYRAPVDRRARNQ